MTKFSRSLLLLLCLGNVCAAEVEDDVTGYLETADPVVVTATRTAESGFSLPYAVDNISQQRFEQRQYRTTPQAFRDTPGIFVQETGPGQGSPYIRGFTGYRTLMLIDGVRLNNSVFRDGPNQYWNTVDPYSVSGFDVVKGPSSVLYGSDAIGGTVNAITVAPYSYGDGWQVNGKGLFRGATAENSFLFRGEVSAGYKDRVGFVGGITPKHFGDLVAGEHAGRQEGTGYDDFGGDAKLEFFLKDASRLVFLFQDVNQNNVPRWHKTVNNGGWHGTAPGSELQRDLDQDRQLLYGQWHKEDIGGAVDAVHVNLSWHQQSEERDRLRTPSNPGDPPRQDIQGFTVDTLGVWASLDSETAIGKLTYGAEWYRDWVSSYSSSNPIQGPVADDATYDSIAVYVQDAIAIGKRASIIAGVRYNYAAADANSVSDPNGGGRIRIKDDWSALVGSLRGRYELIEKKWNVFGGVSQGFRAPNLSDLTRFDTARSDEFEIPAPGLDPEYFTQFELGIKGIGPRFRIEASAYYTLVRDQITRFLTGNTNADGESEVTKGNLGDGYIWGIELGAAWDFHTNWTLFGIFTYMEGEVDTYATADPVLTREYISRLMPMSGNLGLRWRSTDGRLWAETIVQMAARADRLSPRDVGDTERIPPSGTPGYAVWFLRGGWNIKEGMQLIVGLENIFDKSYRVHGSGQNMPGFNAVLTFSSSF